MAAIIFDWDGVLASSLDLYFDLYGRVADHYGVPRPFVDGDGFRDWYNARWEQNYVSMGFEGSRLQEAMHWVSSRLDYDGVPLYEGVPDMLRGLAEKHRLAIASTTSARIIEARLEREGLRPLFQAVFGGGPAGSDKIGLVGNAFRLMGAPADQTVMVGDTPVDIESARHWGLRAVGVTYGWVSPQRVEAARPDVVVHAPADLARGIEEALQVPSR